MQLLGISLLFNTRVSVGGLFFDASINESHQMEADITSHPIEVGANITDNAVIQPTMVTLNVAVGSVYSMASILSFTSTDRPRDAVAKIRQLQANRTPVTLICRLANYTNMLIKSIVANQTVDTASSAYMTIILQEAIIVDSSAGSIYNNPSSPEYGKNTNEGSKQAGQT